MLRWVAVPWLICWVLPGCVSQKDEYIERPVEALYNTAYDLFVAQDYEKAAKAFGEVERQYPYADWAVKAQLMSAYAHYASGSYGDAIETLQAFVQLHPGHPHVAYAHYLMGLCYFAQVPIVQRDQKTTEDALSAFEHLVRRFPQSPYIADARAKICVLHDHLAGKEMDVARTYQARCHHIAALKRFQTVVQHYGSTSYVPEALYRMIECSIALRLRDEVHVSLTMLEHNAPGSTWYSKACRLAQKHYPDLCNEKK